MSLELPAIPRLVNGVDGLIVHINDRLRRISLGLGQGAPGAAGLAQTAAPAVPTLNIVQIQAGTAGDNVVIASAAGVKHILEVVMWNVSAQNLRWTQGLSTGSPITLLDLPSFPALSGYTLGFNGSFDMSHWDLVSNQPLVLNLSAGTQVTGFVRYTVT